MRYLTAKPSAQTTQNTHYEKIRIFRFVGCIRVISSILELDFVVATLMRGALAAAIKRKAGRLKKTYSFKSAFICPDRTMMQRKEHKECVAELRRRCADQPERLHLIRDGMVVSRDKENRTERDNGNG